MPGGLILLGQGESLIGLTNQLEPSRDFRGAWGAADPNRKPMATSVA
jgi:chemotaxis protein methyltransferase CheR